MAVRPVQLDVLRADGTEERVTLSMRSLLEVERKWPGLKQEGDKVVLLDAPTREANLFALWITETKPTLLEGAEAESAFYDYIDSLLAWEPVVHPQDPSEPTPGDAE